MDDYFDPQKCCIMYKIVKIILIDINKVNQFVELVFIRVCTNLFIYLYVHADTWAQ